MQGGPQTQLEGELLRQAGAQQADDKHRDGSQHALDLAGMTALVTGGRTGVGYEVAPPPYLHCVTLVI